MKELLDQGVDPTDDYTTYGNTGHFDPVGGGYGGLQTDDGYMDASDPVCPQCGRFAVWEDCYMCGGEGEFDAYDDDPLWYDPGDTETCPECNGRGGWWICDNRDCTQGVLAEKGGE